MRHRHRRTYRRAHVRPFEPARRDRRARRARRLRPDPRRAVPHHARDDDRAAAADDRAHAHGGGDLLDPVPDLPPPRHLSRQDQRRPLAFARLRLQHRRQRARTTGRQLPRPAVDDDAGCIHHHRPRRRAHCRRPRSRMRPGADAEARRARLLESRRACHPRRRRGRQLADQGPLHLQGRSAARHRNPTGHHRRLQGRQGRRPHLRRQCLRRPHEHGPAHQLERHQPHSGVVGAAQEAEARPRPRPFGRHLVLPADRLRRRRGNRSHRDRSGLPEAHRPVPEAGVSHEGPTHEALRGRWPQDPAPHAGGPLRSRGHEYDLALARLRLPTPVQGVPHPDALAHGARRHDHLQYHRLARRIEDRHGSLPACSPL